VRPMLPVGGTLVALTALLALAAPIAAARAVAAPAVLVDAIEVSLDRSRHSTAVGDRFVLRSLVSNPGPSATDRLIAHLNVASLTSEVYVDPEDWSAERTQEVQALAPGASAELDWELQAVNAGSFAVYVVVLPGGAATAGTGPLAVSPPLHLRVAGRRTLNAGGALPVVLAVPLLLAALTVAARSRIGRPG